MFSKSYVVYIVGFLHIYIYVYNSYIYIYIIALTYIACSFLQYMNALYWLRYPKTKVCVTCKQYRLGPWACVGFGSKWISVWFHNKRNISNNHIFQSLFSMEWEIEPFEYSSMFICFCKQQLLLAKINHGIYFSQS